MKKTIAIILVLCLFLGLCACGGKSEPSEQAKSNEAQKADELILAIGKVSLKKESKILAAEAYYNTLSDEQKNQVANTDILEEAIEELNTLKEEKEYEELWERALEYEKDGLLDKAYAAYKDLPSGYEEVDQKIAMLKPYVELLGYWISNETENVASDGTIITNGTPMFAFECGGVLGEKIFINYSGTIHSDASMNNNSIFKGAFDLQMDMLSGTLLGEMEAIDNKSVYYGKTEAGRSNWGNIEIMFYINSAGNLEVRFVKTANGKEISVVFEYTKKEY